MAPSPPVFSPPPAFAAAAEVGSAAAREALCAAAAADPAAFWAREARARLRWEAPFTQSLDARTAPGQGFADGRLNVSVNCLDRHLPGAASRPAIVAFDEAGGVRTLTYGELHRQVCALATHLQGAGLVPGDRVAILLPNVPEAVVAMQACARLGLMHAVIFAGFSAAAVHGRLCDAGAKVVITADGGQRAGRPVPLKAVVDEALGRGGCAVVQVLVLRHCGREVVMDPRRDVWWDEAVVAGAPCAPVALPATQPLFLLYTSGSTGRPKGVVHGSAGYLLGAVTSLAWAFDLRETDVWWCTADVGWITGHTYVAYGPLAAGCTVVMFDGAPTQPDGRHLYGTCARAGATILYTAPTAVRALMRHGEQAARAFDLGRLRLLGAVGEALDAGTWTWLHRVVGGGRCPIVDTWWQTETGSAVVAPMPGAVPTKPGSCALPLPGVALEVVDPEGRPLPPGRPGTLLITRPGPSMFQGLWQDPERCAQAYWRPFGPGRYLTGDAAVVDEDGYLWILGRTDDVLNVAGHRLGSGEIEAALAAHPRVGEVAVVGQPDALRGEAVCAFVVLRPGGAAPDAALHTELVACVVAAIGAIARPAAIHLCDALPKTRSGKVVRRLLRQLAAGSVDDGDTTTLEDPQVLRALRAQLR